MVKSKTAQDEPALLSAGVIIVRFIEQIPHYLLLRVYGYWDFPKGLVEKGEKPLEAAKREVEEETTLSGLDFRWGQEYRQTEPYSYGTRKRARYYLAASPTGEVNLPVSPELGRPEHHEFRWFPYEEARTLLSERVQPIFDWANDLVVRNRRKSGE